MPMQMNPIAQTAHHPQQQERNKKELNSDDEDTVQRIIDIDPEIATAATSAPQEQEGNFAFLP